LKAEAISSHVRSYHIFDFSPKKQTKTNSRKPRGSAWAQEAYEQNLVRELSITKILYTINMERNAASPGISTIIRRRVVPSEEDEEKQNHLCSIEIKE
jgi:hypothetical protein